jgi:hypothetical protein
MGDLKPSMRIQCLKSRLQHAKQYLIDAADPEQGVSEVEVEPAVHSARLVTVDAVQQVGYSSPGIVIYRLDDETKMDLRKPIGSILF